MSGKYAFSQALKEVRFLFCQTGEHSGPTRSVVLLLFSSSSESSGQWHARRDYFLSTAQEGNERAV
jgi:hypothetical protein